MQSSEVRRCLALWDGTFSRKERARTKAKASTVSLLRQHGSQLSGNGTQKLKDAQQLPPPASYTAVVAARLDVGGGCVPVPPHLERYLRGPQLLISPRYCGCHSRFCARQSLHPSLLNEFLPLRRATREVSRKAGPEVKAHLRA